MLFVLSVSLHLPARRARRRRGAPRGRRGSPRRSRRGRRRRAASTRRVARRREPGSVPGTGGGEDDVHVERLHPGDRRRLAGSGGRARADAPRVPSGLRARAPRRRRSYRAGPEATPSRPAGAAEHSPAVRRSASAPRPSRASAAPSGRRRRRRRRRSSADRGPRRRSRPRAVSTPSWAPRPMPRTARQKRARIARADFPTRPPGW